MSRFERYTFIRYLYIYNPDTAQWDVVDATQEDERQAVVASYVSQYDALKDACLRNHQEEVAA